MAKRRRTFSAEFKRDAANLVLDQGYSIAVKSLESVSLSCYSTYNSTG